MVTAIRTVYDGFCTMTYKYVLGSCGMYNNNRYLIFATVLVWVQLLCVQLLEFYINKQNV